VIWIAATLVIAVFVFGSAFAIGLRACPRCGSRRTTVHTGYAPRLIYVCRACGTVFDHNRTILS
jgi:DNA-directed RNA polymerase subunit RPC12/RpoP